MRSLLCITTNCRPHERFFRFQCTTHGNSLPSWLMNPGLVLLRGCIRTSKSSPLVDQVDLIDSNQSFACIRYPDGRESTVSVQDLAPYPAGTETLSPHQTSQQSSIEIPPKPASVELTDMQNESSVSSEVVITRKITIHQTGILGKHSRDQVVFRCLQKGMIGTKITRLFPNGKGCHK